MFEMARSIYNNTQFPEHLHTCITTHRHGLYCWVACSDFTTSYWSPCDLVQIVNFGSHAVNLTISAAGLQAGVDAARSTVTVLTSNDLLAENSFNDPNKARRCLYFAYGLLASYIIHKICCVTLHEYCKWCRLCRWAAVYPELQKRCMPCCSLTRSRRLIWLLISTASS